MGIKTPKGRDVWNESTVKSILTNEKYKGCALLQKHYTADYLTKKIVRNDGAVPQYYVEDCHEAIKAEREKVAADIRQRGIRRREFERFITTLESLPDEVTDFSEDLWGSLVEYLTVYAKDDLRFMRPCEVEMGV